MRLSVLGGCGAWPTKVQACSGYLLESAGFTLLIDPGYSTLPHLFDLIEPTRLDAVLVSHGHPDHCADLNPLLRCRALGEDVAPALPTYSPPGALDAVLALDRVGMLDDAIEIHEFGTGARLTIGPFQVDIWSLPHFVANAGMRISADDCVLAYTGDTGPTEDLIDLAKDADLFLAEASYAVAVPNDAARYLSSATDAGATSHRAGVARLMLTHLLPGTDADAATECAARGYGGDIMIARPGGTIELDPRLQ